MSIHLLGIYESINKDNTVFRNENWYKAITKRRLYEQYKTETDESGFDFLPDREDVCYPKNFDGFTHKCILGIEDDDL